MRKCHVLIFFPFVSNEDDEHFYLFLYLLKNLNKKVFNKILDKIGISDEFFINYVGEKFYS